MRKKNNQFQIVAFIIGVIVLGVIRESRATDDAILAVVNDELITLRDFKEYLNTIYMQQVADGKAEEEIRKIMTDYEIKGINNLIDDKLLVAEANRQKLEVRDKVINDRLDAIKKHYESEQQFLYALSADGVTITDIRNKISDQLKAHYIVEKEVRSKIFVNPQEVTDFYQKNLDRYKEEEKIDLDSIFIAFGEDQNKAKAKAEEALEALKKGKSFKEVAKQYSDAPSIGLIQKGQLLPSLEKSIFKLQEGEVSPLIDTDNGYYIFKAKKIIPSKMANLDDVKNDIYTTIFQKKFQENLAAWLEKLRKQAYIEIKS